MLIALCCILIFIVEAILFTAIFSWAAGIRVTSLDIVKALFGSKK